MLGLRAGLSDRRYCRGRGRAPVTAGRGRSVYPVRAMPAGMSARGGQGQRRDREGAGHRLPGRWDPDPQPRVGGPLLSGHSRAAHQRVLRRRLPGGHPRRHRRRAGRGGISQAVGTGAVGHHDPLDRPGGGGDGAGPVPRAGALSGSGDDAAGGGGAIPPRASTAPGSRSRTPGSVRRWRAPTWTPRSPSATWSRSSGSAGSTVLAQPIVLRAGAGGAAAAPERGGRAAAGAAGGGPVLQPAVPEDPRARRAQGGRPGGGGGPAGPGLRGHPLDRGRAGPSALGSAGGAVLAAGAARQQPSRPGAGSRWWTRR